MMKKPALFLIIALTAAAFAQDGPPKPQPPAGAEAFRSRLITVSFEPNSTKPTPPSIAALDSAAAVIRLNAQRRYEVLGRFCPDAEDQGGSMQFSMRRVSAVVNFLLKNGVPAANIATAVNPADPGNAAAGECTDDRRVDIVSAETRQPAPIAAPEPAGADLKPAPAESAPKPAAIPAEPAAWAASRRPALTYDDLPDPPAAEADPQAAQPPAPDPTAITTPESTAAPGPVGAGLKPAPTHPAAATTPESTATPGPVGAGLKPAPTPIDHTPDGKPTLAIYMAGQEPQGVRGVHNILGGELARTISESEKYLAVDRTDAITEALTKEHVYQRTGAVDDDQIKALGKQLGANYLCISNINAVEGKRSYYLDARLVDVVTAEIIRTATMASRLKDANEMFRVARDIAYELIETDKARAQRLRKKKIFLYTSIGLDILGAGAIAYGLMENNTADNLLGSEDYPEADKHAKTRNIAYIIGGAFLAGGVTIHIFF